MPLVSIITPAYISSTDKLIWLKEAIESVISQSLVDWEMIIVNDDSPILLDELRGIDPRVRWFDASANQGPAMCRNSAVALAKSECILPLDADDMLASPEVLQAMYDVWKEVPGSIIYGDLQRLIIQNNTWNRTKILQLPEYTFERAMDLNGIIPVTAMHSRECHFQAGGWKPELEYGLEDVEYWIAAGKRGFCGHKINLATLLYRRQQDSRAYKLQHGDGNQSRQEEAMRGKIIAMHDDIFNGRFPMACCGKGNSSAANSVLPLVGSGKITTLDSVAANQKLWVEYVGPKGASFQIVGRATRAAYRVQGTGHKFEVHVDDQNVFRSLGRGRDYIVGIPEPVQSPPEPEKVEEPLLLSPETQPVMAELLSIESQDPVQPIPVLVETTFTEMSLDALELSEALTEVLVREDWSISKLANTNPDELLGYSGIGPARSKQIVEKAKELWQDQTR